MKIAFILGTRPEIIKLSSVIKECIKYKLDYFIIHTNQHYSKNMDYVFFKELLLPPAKYNLKIGSESHGCQTGQMLIKIEEILIQEKPTHVIVQGDTNSVLAGALTTSKLHIKLGHVEAGLRSYDRTMPEEINRVVTDHISDYLFCPTNKQQEILISEGLDENKIFVTGNTIVDVVFEFKNNINEDMLKKFGIEKKKYILLTMHRPSNVDNKNILNKHLNNISKLGYKYKINIIFPIHPRTLKNIKKFNLKVPSNIKIINPLGFTEMIGMEYFSKINLTDSGGVQEESCILGTPSLNLRLNTERPECVEVGASKITGSNLNLLKEGFDHFSQTKNLVWKNPFGDGHAGKKIMNIILN